ncbi:MAG: tripartite tricarboxylate transporter TctB family protein [Alphaproteobacteria bacterium]
MDQQSTSGTPEKKSVGGDLVIPVAALLFTLYYFSTIIDSPWTAQVSAFFVGTILIFLVIVFLVVTVRSVMRGEADWRFESLLAPVSYIPKRIALFGLTLGYIFVIQWTGFTLTAFAFLALAMLLLGEGRNKRLILILSGTLALGGYLLFIVAFERRFPAGPFELLMKALF